MSPWMRSWTGNTPGRLKLLIAASWVLAAALGIVVLVSTSGHRDATHDIAVDAAPSVVAAHNVRIEIESLDADLIDEMLVEAEAKDTWKDDFAKNRVDIGHHIIAAVHSAYGEDEQEPVERLEAALGEYLMAAEAARDAHFHEGHDAAVVAYNASFRILEDKLVAAASDLDKISDTQLDEAYERQLHRSRNSQILVIVLGVAVVAMLLVTQLFVFRRFRRMITPGIAAAVVVAAGLTLYTVIAFRKHASDLRGMKEDAYESVDALLRARADVYEMVSSESRALFDREHAATHQQRYDDYKKRVLVLANGQSFDNIADILKKREAVMAKLIDRGTRPRDAGAEARKELPLGGPKGKLAEALDNVTFADSDPHYDEPTQAADAVHDFGVYIEAETKVGQAERNNQHAEAVRESLSDKPGDTHFAFMQFDEAMDRWINIDAEWMKYYSDRAAKDIRLLPYVAPVGVLLLMVLVLLGLRPRLEEYV